MEETYGENGFDIYNHAEVQQERIRSQIAASTNNKMNKSSGSEVDEVSLQEKREQGLHCTDDQLSYHELSLSAVEDRCAELAAAHERTMAVFAKVCEKIKPGADNCAVPEDGALENCSDDSEPEFRFHDSLTEINSEFPAETVGDEDDSEWTSCSDEETVKDSTHRDSSEALEGCTLESFPKFTIESMEAQEVFYKEKCNWRRRGNKKTVRQLSQTLLTAILDAVDATFGSRGPGGSTSRAPFSTSRRNGAPSRMFSAQEADDAATESGLCSTRRLSSIVAAIETRLEHLAQFVLASPAADHDSPHSGEDQLRTQLLEIEQRLAELLPAVGDQKQRPRLRARLEQMSRRLLRLRAFTDVDVQAALKDARRHLRAAHAAAARLTPVYTADWSR